MAFFKNIRDSMKTATSDRQAYWGYQYAIGKYYIDHFVPKQSGGKKVLDIGCGEGGVLAAFFDQGYQCTGLDKSSKRLAFANSINTRGIRFICGDIEDYSNDEKYDIILMLDVIEHVNHKKQVLLNVKKLLSHEGRIIITFPPFRSPFGGHQQMLRSFLRFIPYLHLLPRSFYFLLIKSFEKKHLKTQGEILNTGITIGTFEKLLRECQLQVTQRVDYLVRPRQGLRFNIKPRLNRFPLLKEFFTTGVTFVLISQNDQR